MPQVEIQLDDSLLSEVEYLADEEFTNQDEAVEKLLAAGIKTYNRDLDDSLEAEFMDEYQDMWDPETDTF